MDIRGLASISGDSELLGYSFSDGTLEIELRVPELSDAVVVISTGTRWLMANVPREGTAPQRTCYIDITDLKGIKSVNEDGILVPAADFGPFMRQVRNGIALAYGLQTKEWSWLLRIVGTQTLLACVIRDLGGVRCETAVTTAQEAANKALNPTGNKPAS